MEPHALFPGVGLRAIGGEQVLLCHVTYEPGTTVLRHSHETAEQVMWIIEGDVTITVGDETKRLGSGDVVGRQFRCRARASLRERPDLHRGARAGAAGPRSGCGARPRPRRAGRLAPRRSLTRGAPIRRPRRRVPAWLSHAGHACRCAPSLAHRTALSSRACRRPSPPRMMSTSCQGQQLVEQTSQSWAVD